MPIRLLQLPAKFQRKRTTYHLALIRESQSEVRV